MHITIYAAADELIHVQRDTPPPSPENSGGGSGCLVFIVAVIITLLGMTFA